MNTIIKYWICCFYLFTHTLTAQNIRGTVQDTEGTSLIQATVTLKNTNYTTKTDATGTFAFSNIPQGKYTMLAFTVGKAVIEKEVTVGKLPLEVHFVLEDLNEKLETVTLEANNEESIVRMRGVENFGIYEGKKTEVIVLKELTANLSTNNPRQVFSQIVGLNIWESDGVGLQLGIGGRGLSPNRTSNFNVRQNGYDISADALGYPESYYTPPAEALERIEMVRGAASLQYGTQFGGMVNFKFKQGAKDKKIELTSRQSAGSWGYLGTFNSVGGTVGKLNYYAYHQYKTGKGYRPNSQFDYQNAFASLQYKFSERFSATLDITKMHYLAQQAGGLTDKNFQENPRQSFRERNWFKVDWNLASLQLTYQIHEKAKINSRTFGLIASRHALGNLEKINVADLGGNRTLIAGEFDNIGNETRYLQNYTLAGKNMAFLAGVRIYRGITTARQGEADNGKEANFNYLNPENLENSDYIFPNENYAIFVENIFNLTDKLSLTPGLRWENIRTFAEGYYKQRVFDGAGNLVAEKTNHENLERKRNFLIAGLGISYKANDHIELYGNFSQNYRAINFTDLRIQNPNFIIDPNIQDEKGYTADAGLRGAWKNLDYEATVFYLAYRGRIGQVLRADLPPLYNDYRFRGNIADARNIGVEFLGKWRFKKVFHTFLNVAWVDARYINTNDTSIKNKKVEMVPPIMLRTGLSYKFKNFATTLQWAYIGKHFSDATNAIRTATAVEGVIPAYQVADFSARYTWKMLTFEGSINNLLNTKYFTRRAEGYPGPGIIPADGRGFYMTVQARL
jgi:Fe(3+) dicitrate transport protein